MVKVNRRKVLRRVQEGKSRGGVRGSKNKCASGATGVSGEGPGEPLLIIGAENRNGFLLAIDRGEDATNPEDKKSNEKHRNKQQIKKRDYEEWETNESRDEQPEHLAEMIGTDPGFFCRCASRSR